MIDFKPRVFVIDVDGVMTNGLFHYSENGKIYKEFGPDDNDALRLLQSYMQIHFVTGDKRGFPISKSRIADDMKFPLDLVSTIERAEWISQKYDLNEVIYMGDGIFDFLVFEKVGYSIAPQNGDDFTKSKSNYITKRRGGDRAVSEACQHILKEFFDESVTSILHKQKRTDQDNPWGQ